MSAPEIKPCPFCGERPEVTKHFKFELYGLTHRCKVIPSIVMDFAEPGYNEVKWNTRTESAISQRLERAEKALRQIANMPDENDEWDGAERYRVCRELAGAALSHDRKEAE